MYRIVLLNPPVTDIHIASIALTQLKSVLDEQFGGRVSTEICYINHDFARYLGYNLHQVMFSRYQELVNGLAEWFFSQTAFPAAPDNTEEYLQHFFPGSQKHSYEFYMLLKKRRGLEAFLDEVIECYQLGSAQLVGLTSMFTQNLASFSLARKLKERNADIVTVMGGPNCETPMGEEIVKNVEAMDFVFSGPALITFPQFVEYRLNSDLESCHQIPGVFSKVNCPPEDPRHICVGIGSAKGTGWGLDGGKPHPTPSVPTAPVRSLPVHTKQSQIGPGTIGQERDINVVVELDYRSFLHSIKSHFPKNKVPPVLPFETSRGCWWGERAHCTFCGLNGLSMNYRVMSPQKAIPYLKSLFAYADECSYFNCVDNILPRSYTKEVMPFLNTPPHVTVFYEVKADLSEEDVQRLAQARVNHIQPGIEALATSTLKLMKKGTTAFQNLRLLKHCVAHEVFPIWNILIGFPGEKEEVYQKYVHDLPRLTHLPPPSACFPVRFDRYSPYFALAQEYGLDLVPFAFYRFAYPWSEESLRGLAYHFDDQNLQADYSVAARKWLDKIEEQIHRWNSAWWPAGVMRTTPIREVFMARDKRSQQNRPRLLLKTEGDETLIHDSRSGKLQSYQIRETTKHILRYLDQPHKKADLIAQFAHLAPPTIEQEMAFLQERGLLFEEDDRFLSLVLPARRA